MIEYPQGQWAMQPTQPDEMVAIQIADPVEEDAMVVDEEIGQLPAEGKFYQRLRAFDSQGRPYEVITCVQLPQDPGSEDPEELVSFVKALARSLEALQQQVSQQFDVLGAAVWEGVQVDTFLVKQVAELQQQMAAAHQACLDRARGEERCEESCAALVSDVQQALEVSLQANQQVTQVKSDISNISSQLQKSETLDVEVVQLVEAAVLGAVSEVRTLLSALELEERLANIESTLTSHIAGCSQVTGVTQDSRDVHRVRAPLPADRHQAPSASTPATLQSGPQASGPGLEALLGPKLAPDSGHLPAQDLLAQGEKVAQQQRIRPDLAHFDSFKTCDGPGSEARSGPGLQDGLPVQVGPLLAPNLLNFDNSGESGTKGPNQQIRPNSENLTVSERPTGPSSSTRTSPEVEDGFSVQVGPKSAPNLADFGSFGNFEQSSKSGENQEFRPNFVHSDVPKSTDCSSSSTRPSTEVVDGLPVEVGPKSAPDLNYFGIFEKSSTKGQNHQFRPNSETFADPASPDGSYSSTRPSPEVVDRLPVQVGPKSAPNLNYFDNFEKSSKSCQNLEIRPKSVNFAESERPNGSTSSSRPSAEVVEVFPAQVGPQSSPNLGDFGNLEQTGSCVQHHQNQPIQPKFVNFAASERPNGSSYSTGTSTGVVEGFPAQVGPQSSPNLGDFDNFEQNSASGQDHQIRAKFLNFTESEGPTGPSSSSRPSPGIVGSLPVQVGAKLSPDWTDFGNYGQVGAQGQNQQNRPEFTNLKVLEQSDGAGMQAEAGERTQAIVPGLVTPRFAPDLQQLSKVSSKLSLSCKFTTKNAKILNFSRF